VGYRLAHSLPDRARRRADLRGLSTRPMRGSRGTSTTAGNLGASPGPDAPWSLANEALPSYPLGVAPPSTCRSVVHSGSQGSLGPPVPPGGRVPSTRFLTASTACSDRRSQVCCTLQPIMGFAAFPARLRLFDPKASQRAGARSPQRHPPPEEYPSPAAVPRHRGHCPPAVTPRTRVRARSRRRHRRGPKPARIRHVASSSAPGHPRAPLREPTPGGAGDSKPLARPTQLRPKPTLQGRKLPFAGPSGDRPRARCAVRFPARSLPEGRARIGLRWVPASLRAVRGLRGLLRSPTPRLVSGGRSRHRRTGVARVPFSSAAVTLWSAGADLHFTASCTWTEVRASRAATHPRGCLRRVQTSAAAPAPEGALATTTATVPALPRAGEPSGSGQCRNGAFPEAEAPFFVPTVRCPRLPAPPVARRGVQRFHRRAANFRALLH
jgi:hypothetical protein